MLADPTHVLSQDFAVYIEAEGVAERDEVCPAKWQPGAET